MSKEAMKLALEAFDSMVGRKPERVEQAITALREALAKPDFWEGYVPEPVKPAQQALDKKAENARELGLDYEPQRWAVFCQGCRKEWSVSYPHPGKSICADCDDKLAQYSGIVSDGGLDPRNKFDKSAQDSGVVTAGGFDPRTQRTWVGLTDGERNGLWRVIVGWGDPSHDDVDLMKAIEEALRKKNT